MKNITKKLIVTTFAFAFLVMQPGLLNAAAESTSYTIFNGDNKPTAQVAIGAKDVSGSGFASSQTAQAGETVTLKIRYKNTGNWDASNTKVEVVKTEGANESGLQTSTFSVKIWADNTSYPATGSTTVSYPSNETFGYIANSLKWYPNQGTASAPLPFGQSGNEVWSAGSGLNLGVIKSKFSCPQSNPDCREGHLILQFKVSGTIVVPPPASSLSVSSVAASNIGQTSATLNASYANATGNQAEVWFQYGTASTFGSNSVVKTAAGASGNVAIDVTGLAANTTYYFRAVAKDSISIKNAANTLSFTTTGSVVNPPQNLPPTVVAMSPAGVSENAATLRARVNPNGSSTIAWFEYGTSDSNLNKVVGTQNIGNGSSEVAVSFPINDLSANTTYFYRAVASNSAGTVLGGIVSFKTEKVNDTPPAVNAPKALTSLATSIGGSSVKLNGLVIIDATASTKTYFEYGKTIALGSATAAEVVGSAGQVSFSQTVSGLSPNTIYFYRAVAENSFGVSRGEIVVFKTAAVSSGNGGSGTVSQSGLVSLKVSSKFSEVAPGDIIDLTVSYKALAKIEDAVLRVSFPNGVVFTPNKITL
jgi:hypothetical protein